MPELKHLLVSPIIATSVIANIAAVAAQGPDHFHKNEHLMRSEKRGYLSNLKSNLHSVPNEATKGIVAETH